MENITTTLKKLITEHGMEILEQEQRLKAILADLHPNEKRFRYLLELSFRAEIPKKLIAIQNENTSVWETQIASIKYHFKEEYFLEDQALKSIFDLWISIFQNVSIQTSKRQNQEKEPKAASLIKFNTGHFWGLKNLNGKIIVPCKYEDISDFSDGVALVIYAGKSGLINSKGKNITPLMFLNTKIKFINGTAIIKSLDGKYGLINLNGEIIIPTKYDMLYRKIDFFKARLNYKYGILNNLGKIIVSIKYDEIEDFDQKLAKIRINDKWGFINEKGKVVQPLQYSKIEKLNDFLYVCEFSLGYNLINLNGDNAIKATFTKIFGKFKGPRRIQINEKFGFIDEFGAFIIDPIYDDAKDFIEGKSIVGNKKKYGVINEFNNIVIPLKFNKIENIGTGFKVELNQKYGILDINYKPVLPIIYDKINYRDSVGFFVSKAGKFGILNDKGVEILPILYDHIDDNDNNPSPIIIAVKLRNKYGFVDRNGNNISELKYDFALSSSIKTIARSEDKYKFVYLNGDEQLLAYDMISKYSDNYFIVKLNGKYGVINALLKEIIQIKYKNIKIEKGDFFSHDLKIVADSDEYYEEFKIQFDKIIYQNRNNYLKFNFFNP